MPDYVRPNITVPVSLWGEVKVAAFRRGVKPVDVVLECLRERFTESPREAGKQAEVKPELPGDNDVRVQPPKQSKAIGGVPVGPFVEPEFVCKACGKPTDGSFLCPSCKKA